MCGGMEIFYSVSRPSDHPAVPTTPTPTGFPCPLHSHQQICGLEWRNENSEVVVGAGVRQWSSGSRVPPPPPPLLCRCSEAAATVSPFLQGALVPEVLTCSVCEALAFLWAPVCAGCALSSKMAPHTFLLSSGPRAPPTA
uniref:Uncharacterized protein n=1 Tax=Myotis myotis TaxID=51298 RepID=A0A7J7Z5Y9_MYOMY|nr:hypothetical protein mMyoMyo1_010703 [Myotis myotis]